jgi:sugar phosphate permease
MFLGAFAAMRFISQGMGIPTLPCLFLGKNAHFLCNKNIKTSLAAAMSAAQVVSQEQIFLTKKAFLFSYSLGKKVHGANPLGR